MHIRFQFESQLDENTLEDLFDTVATILPEDLYTEQTILVNGVESNHNLVYHVSNDNHCYDLPVTREVTVDEAKSMYSILDNAIQGDYMLEFPAKLDELENRYNFQSFEGNTQEGNLD